MFKSYFIVETYRLEATPLDENQIRHVKHHAAAAFSNLTAGCVSIHSIEHLCPKSSLILLHPVIIIVGLLLAVDLGRSTSPNSIPSREP